MDRQYYRMSTDQYVPERWHIKDPISPDGSKLFAPWGFRAVDKLQGIGPLVLPVKYNGRPLDIDFTIGTWALVISERVAPVFYELAQQDVQLLPAEVSGHAGRYYIANAARVIDCLDIAASRGVRYVTEADMQPERLGQIFYIDELCIDPARASNAHVFRAAGYPLPLIVSGQVKAALERLRAVGGHFEPVTRPHAPG